jgi:hypothetical protein
VPSYFPLLPSGISAISVVCYFLRQLRARRRVKSAKQQEELFDYGKKMFCDGIGCVRIRVWNYGALKRRHRYG